MTMRLVKIPTEIYHLNTYDWNTTQNIELVCQIGVRPEITIIKIMNSRIDKPKLLKFKKRKRI